MIYVRPQMDDLCIPEGILGGIERYFESRIKPGSALTAILKNDLRTAMALSDSYTKRAMPDILTFLERSDVWLAWGSTERVNAWLAGGGK